MVRVQMVTLAGLTWLGGVTLAHSGVERASGAGGSVVTVRQVGREVAGTVAALPSKGRHAIALSAYDVPAWTLAGGRYRARFIVRNQGDVQTTVVLTLATQDSLTRVEPSQLSLKAGASAVVTVVATGARDQGVLAIALRATDRDAPEVHATATAQTRVLGHAP